MERLTGFDSAKNSMSKANLHKDKRRWNPKPIGGIIPAKLLAKIVVSDEFGLLLSIVTIATSMALLNLLTSYVMLQPNSVVMLKIVSLSNQIFSFMTNL